MTTAIRQYSVLLIAYLAPQRARVALLAILIPASIGLQLAAPQVLRTFIDATQQGIEHGPLLAVGALFLGLALGQRLAGFAALYLSEYIGWNATNALRADLARHCLQLDMGFHKQRTPGELIERIDGDSSALAGFFSQFTVKVLGNTLLVLGILAMLWREAWRVGLGLSLYTVLAFAALVGLQRVATTRWIDVSRRRAELFGFIEERIGGAEDIRASGSEAHILEQHAVLSQRGLEAERGALMAGNITSAATTFLFVAGYAIGLALGAWLYASGQASVGTAFLVVYYIGMLAPPLERIREQAEDLQRAASGIARIEELRRLSPRVHERPIATLPAGALDVIFDDVTFEYDDDAAEDRASAIASKASPRTTGPVLHNISFRLDAGTVLGLLGRTGSGKSTITRLLFRLYDPGAGSIRLNGHDLRDLAFDDLRTRVGIVTQEVQLFNATLRDNLTLFSRRIDDAEIERALGELGLRDWALRLPHGLDTRLGVGAVGLSAGEAQLLAFARVFLRNPGLIILDEASSRLDPATERLLEQAIDRLLAGRTGIIVAHRLATVQRADMIAILDSGRLAEYGPRARLAADPASRFAALLRRGLGLPGSNGDDQQMLTRAQHDGPREVSAGNDGVVAPHWTNGTAPMPDSLIEAHHVRRRDA
ncbi:MAG: ABC transporter ATP-binding protein [Chloroflexi bacterium]|nr:ABC transporter ATP-binding protein [Chloroflexota bacterium]